MTEDNLLNSDETAIYDRQIRVWGFQAQQKMKNSIIGVIGTSGLAIELMKNVVLAGVGKLFIIDNKEVTETEIGSNFYITTNDIGKKRAQICASKLSKLNPKVVIECLDQLNDENINDIQLICHTDGNLEEMKNFNRLCRKKGIKYISGNTFGFYGYIFFDLLDHKFIIEKEDKVIESHTISYKDLDSVLNSSVNCGTKKQILRKYSPTLFIIQILHHFITQMGRKPNPNETTDLALLTNLSQQLANNIFKVNSKLASEIYMALCSEWALKETIMMCQGELSPTTAIIGGILAQEALKTVSEKDPPINNIFVYYGMMGDGLVHHRA